MLNHHHVTLMLTALIPLVAINATVLEDMKEMVSHAEVYIDHRITIVMLIILISRTFNLIADIDECEISSPCVNADCINEDGNYSCGLCYHGFRRRTMLNSQQPCC